MKELVAGARWNLRPCARSPRLRMSFRLRKRARNQRTWTVPPTGAFPTRTRGFHGVNCRANARFGSVVEGAELQFVPPRGIGPGEGRRNGGVHRAFDAAFAHRIASLWRFRALFNPPCFTARSEPHRDRGKRHTHRVLSRFFFSRRGGTTSTSGAVEQASTTPVGAPTSPEAAVSKVSEVSAVVNATEGEFMS